MSHSLIPSPPSTKADLRRLAYALRGAIRSGDADAMRRVRAVYHDLRDADDAAVVARMGIGRCEHVIAREQTGGSWSSVPDGDVRSEPAASPLSGDRRGHVAIAMSDAAAVRALDVILRAMGRPAAIRIRFPDGLPSNAAPSDVVDHPAMHVNPCLGTRAESGFIVDWMRHLLAPMASRDVLDARTTTVLIDAIGSAFAAARTVATWSIAADLERLRASGPGRRWLDRPSKWVMVEPTAIGEATRVHPVGLLLGPDGAPLGSIDEARRQMSEQDARWLSSRRIGMIDGTMQRDLGGVVLVLPAAADRIEGVVPSSIAARMRRLPGVLVLDVGDRSDLAGHLAGLRVKLVSMPDGASDPSAILSRIAGTVDVQGEVTMGDIAAMIPADEPIRACLAAYVDHGVHAWAWDWRGTDIRHLTDVRAGDTRGMDMTTMSSYGPHFTEAAIAAILHCIDVERRGSRSPLVLILDGCAPQRGHVVDRAVREILSHAADTGITVVCMNRYVDDIAGLVCDRLIGRVFVDAAQVRIMSMNAARIPDPPSLRGKGMVPAAWSVSPAGSGASWAALDADTLCPVDLA